MIHPHPPFTWIFVKLFMACVSSKVVRSSSIMQNLSLVFGHTSFPWCRCWSHGVLYVQITEGSAKMMKKRAFHLPPQKGPTIHVCHSTTKYTQNHSLFVAPTIKIPIDAPSKPPFTECKRICPPPPAPNLVFPHSTMTSATASPARPIKYAPRGVAIFSFTKTQQSFTKTPPEFY